MASYFPRPRRTSSSAPHPISSFASSATSFVTFSSPAPYPRPRLPEDPIWRGRGAPWPPRATRRRATSELAESAAISNASATDCGLAPPSIALSSASCASVFPLGRRMRASTRSSTFSSGMTARRAERGRGLARGSRTARGGPARRASRARGPLEELRHEIVDVARDPAAGGALALGNPGRPSIEVSRRRRPFRVVGHEGRPPHEELEEHRAGNAHTSARASIASSSRVILAPSSSAKRRGRGARARPSRSQRGACSWRSVPASRRTTRGSPPLLPRSMRMFSSFNVAVGEARLVERRERLEYPVEDRLELVHVRRPALANRAASVCPSIHS